MYGRGTLFDGPLVALQVDVDMNRNEKTFSDA